MIVCVSLNPAMDRRIELGRLEVGTVQRAHRAEALPGGKAAHVALAARALGMSSTWLGFLGGATGDVFALRLAAEGISVEAIPVQTETRVNLELIDDHGVTELLEPGGPVTPLELESLEQRLDALVLNREVAPLVVLSGSLPKGAPVNVYATLIRRLRQHGCRILVDTHGEPLARALGAGPDAVKPNREEVENLLGLHMEGPSAAAAAARRLTELGASLAIVSLGSEGLVAFGGDLTRPVRVSSTPIATRSAVGSGDATMAGLAKGLSQGLGTRESLELAVACGAANCLAPAPGRLRPEDVESHRSQVFVESL